MRAFPWRPGLVLALIASAILAASALAGTRGLDFRLYDPTARTRTVVTGADLVRSSARATRKPDGSGNLYFRLTKHGVAKFRLLTRELARRGARARQPQVFAIALNGTVYVRALVDYKTFPDGVDAEAGLNIRMRLPAARTLAEAIRGE